MTKLIFLCIVTGVFMAVLVPAAAASDPAISPETVYAFAVHLEETSDYYRAITEYKRFLFLWPDHPRASMCRYRIGRAYLQGSDYATAMDVFQTLLADTPPSLEKKWIEYDYAAALYGHQRFARSAAILKHAEQLETDTALKQQIRYSGTWCHLQRSDLTVARSLWPDPENPIRIALDRMPVPEPKNPRVAGIMSAVLPGSGQIYAGRWRDGVVSFLVNGLFIGAIVTAINTDHEETAAVLGFFELGFYSANIYNAVNDVHKENKRQWKMHLHQLERDHGPPFRLIYRF